MQDISGFGLSINISASVTFPAGFVVTQFADDADPLDAVVRVIGDKSMGLNGDMLFWSTANPLEITLNVIPGGPDDRNLEAIADANTAARGKYPARDRITLVQIYPNGDVVTLSEGKMISSIPQNAIASAGRLKSKPYAFAFEQVNRKRGLL